MESIGLFNTYSPMDSLILWHFPEKFYAEGKEIELRGIAGKLGKIISSNGMTKLLKKEQRGVIAQLCSLDVSTSKSSISLDLQKVLDNHSKVFETSWNQMNNMIMIMNRWETFGSLKYLGMIVQDFLEI